MTTFDTPEPISATIEITLGNVWVHASDRADTVVEVRPTDPAEDADVQIAEKITVDYADGRLTVKAPKEWARSLFRRSGSVDVMIGLPEDSSIDATLAADFRGEGRLGETSVRTALGTIRLDDTGRLWLSSGTGAISVARSTGHTEVTTANGDIRIGRIDGTAVVKTSNGNVTLGEVTGDLRLNTAYGDLAIDRALASVTAKTAYGSVRVGEVVRGSVVLLTSYGELELGVREGTAAWLDVSSGFGNVHSSLETSAGPASSDETVEVRGRTGFGDIVIRRSSALEMS
jgi:DUF4097 and DUF4098 domain-containing protein YvlB